MHYYAGIGSRETPSEVLKKMATIAFRLPQLVLRSGAAIGADKAFESGADSVLGAKEIFTTKKFVQRARNQFIETSSNDPIPQAAFDMAEKFHPNWKACADYAKALHARNSLILFGAKMDKPVDFIVCWTKDGKITGGTGQALRIAKAYNIPVYNLALIDDLPETFYANKETEK